jgi:hypothetical protein
MLMAVVALAVSGLAVVMTGSEANAVTVTNACINSAVPTDFTQVNVDMTGTAPASVEPGAQFQLTNITQSVSLPGAIFVAGYNLGLLQVGVNTVPGTVVTTIEGTNTVEGTQNTSTEAVLLTFTITDPDGVPGTGDETATDATINVTYDDQTWTAGPAGAIEFREDTVTPQSATVAGIRVTATIGGFLTVRFGCNPGVVLPGPPEVIQLIDPAPSFASTVSETPTTTTTATTTTTTTEPPTTTTTTEPPTTTTTTEPPTTTTTTEPTTTTTTEPPPTTTTTTEPPTTTTTTAPTTTTTTTAPTTTTTTSAPTTTTTTAPTLTDVSMNVIVHGPTKSSKTSKSVVAKVRNEGTSNVTVCNSDVTWDIEVNGVDTTGSVSQRERCKTLRPGQSTRFRATWTYGAGEVTAGAEVNYMATVTVAGDSDTSNNTDSEIRIVR